MAARTVVMIMTGLASVVIIIGEIRYWFYLLMLLDTGGDVLADSTPQIISGNLVAMINPISWAIFWAISRQQALRAAATDPSAQPDERRWDRMLAFQIGSGIVVALAGVGGGTWPEDGVISVRPSDWWWYALTGGLMLPVCVLLFSLAPVFISTSEMGCVKMLETVLAPVYAYIYLNEEPTTYTLIGGALLVVAIVGHTIAQVKAEKEEAGQEEVCHSNETKADANPLEENTVQVCTT